MLEKFQSLSHSDPEQVSDLIEKVEADWPQAIRAMERLGGILGEAIKATADPAAPVDQDKPLAFAAYEKGLRAYQSMLREDDPVRLTALVDAMLEEAAKALAQIEIVDALGRVWTADSGTAFEDWLTETSNPVQVRVKSAPGSVQDIKAKLEQLTMDSTTRAIVSEVRTPPPVSELN